ncbi:MAG: hypothetical protein KKF50_01845 [Nanoarchaeota archaeon]|nr:hypothetical protein [Nanoarchaeota archaeon]
MNKKIATLIAGILLVGIVSAGLLTHFAVITGEVIVEGPVFYLDGTHLDGGVYHELYVNEIPPEEEIYFWDGHRLVFKTENLGVDEFYQAEFTMKIWMITNNTGNTIQARIIKLDEENHESTICEVINPVSIGAISSFTKYTFSCESDSEIDLSNYDRIGIEVWGNGDENQEYWISTGKLYTDGYSRVEVSAI